MRKYYLIALVVIVLLLAAGYIGLFAKQVSFHKSLDAETNVFVLENINNANIRIVTAKTDKITIDLNGPKDDLDKVRFFKVGDTSGFGLSDEWQNLTGTITVPEGTLLDVRLSDNSDLTVSDLAKKKTVSSKKNFLVDTDKVSGINSDGGKITINGWGDTIIWDTDGWEDLFGGEGEGEGEEGPPECGIGSQVIRNYCCGRQKQYEEKPSCSGYGYWVFNNSLRECSFSCEERPDQGDDEEEDQDEQPPISCSIGSQTARNSCCAQQNTGAQTPGCIGEWRFNNIIRSCEFHCYTEEELQEYFGEGGDGSGGTGEVLRFCEDFDTQEEKDECCDYNLRNELSIGPHPGYPDCIGRWYFDEENGCSFRCADYYEMQQILKELKERAQQEQ